ncbi:MAG: hypothetical protein ACFNKE_08475, partial [Neisseria elongata]
VTRIVGGTQLHAGAHQRRLGTHQRHGLTLNGGVQYFGKSYQDTQKKYAFPSYTLVDVGARYKTKLGKNTLTVSSSVENLFNKNYWQVQRGQYDRSFAVVGMPRTYWLKAELDF